MANKDDYLTYYREFFENFAQTVNPNDQLPVKLGSYKLVNVEVVGGIIDWTAQYLTQNGAPSFSLFNPMTELGGCLTVIATCNTSELCVLCSTFLVLPTEIPEIPD